MPSRPTDALRRAALAVSVLADIPFEDAPGGTGSPRIGHGWGSQQRWRPLTWDDLAAACGDHDPASEAGCLRLRHWMQVCSWLIGAPEDARRSVVPLGLPRGHVVHPGDGWSIEAVRGDLIDLGLGLRPARDDSPTVPLPPGAARCAGVEVEGWWAAARAHLDAMGDLAVKRLHRDAKAVLTTIGGCEVLTLLGSSALRRHLAHGDGTGMRALAVPIRSRGWFDLARIDPPFVRAASNATSVEDQGLERPLLVTADDVVIAAAPADPAAMAAQVLIDLTISPAALRDVLYR